MSIFKTEKPYKMMNHLKKMGIILITFLLLRAPLVFAHSRSHEQDSIKVEQQITPSPDILNIPLISGLITLILIITTVIAGRLMKKGKIRVKTHHILAYATLILGLTHGIYNLLVH